MVFDGKMIMGRSVVVRELLAWQVSLGRRTIYLKGVSLTLHGLLAPLSLPSSSQSFQSRRGK